MTEPMLSAEELAARYVNAAKRMDWQQVILNGGPPCFHIDDDGRFCARALRWAGHQEHGTGHLFEPLYVAVTQLVKAQARELERMRGALDDARMELQCCVYTFRSMAGSGPAHTERIERTVQRISVLLDADAAALSAPAPAAVRERAEEDEYEGICIKCGKEGTGPEPLGQFIICKDCRTPQATVRVDEPRK